MQAFIADYKTFINTNTFWGHYKAPVMCLDLETTGLDPFDEDILLTGIKLGPNGPSYGFHGLPKELVNILHGYLSQMHNSFLLGHNLKFDLKFLMAEDYNLELAVLDLKSKIFDTMIQEQCLVAGMDVSASLKATAKRRCSIDMDKDIRNEFVGMDPSELDIRHFKYLAGDLEIPYKVFEAQKQRIAKLGMAPKIMNENATVPIIAMMEYYGSRFDSEAWKINILQNESRLKVVTNYMDNSLKKAVTVVNVDPAKEKRYIAKRNNQDVVQVDLFGGQKLVHAQSAIKVNYASPKQVLEIFQDFNQPIPADKHGKPSVGKEPLAKYGLIYPNSPLNEFIQHYREYVQVKKKLSSFGDNMISMIRDGRIHSAYRQHGTATGRLASGDTSNGYPNMNQIPRENNYRTPFIADDDYVYMTIDYSSCELVILAAQSGDKTLAKLLSDPSLDLHSYLANAAWSAVKGHPYQVTKEERQIFKAVNFGLVYGASVFRVADILNITVDEATLVMKALRDTIPDAFAYLDKVGDEAVRQGYVEFNSVTHSRRWFPEVFESREANRYLDRMEEGSIKRKAMNAPIQGTNADITKKAMVKVDQYLKKAVRPGYPKSHIVMQVYDEIVIQIPEGEKISEIVAARIKEIMQDVANEFLDAAGSSLRMASDYKIEKSWIK